MEIKVQDLTAGMIYKGSNGEFRVMEVKLVPSEGTKVPTHVMAIFGENQDVDNTRGNFRSWKYDTYVTIVQ